MPNPTQIVHRPFRYYYLRLLRQRDTPHQVALGVALGVAAGFVVPPGPQMFVAFGLALLLGANRLAAVAGSWVVNPLTMPFLYVGFVVLGRWVLGLETAEALPPAGRWWELVTNYHRHGALLKAFFAGAGLASLPAAGLAYVLTRTLVARRRAARQRRATRGPPATPGA